MTTPPVDPNSPEFLKLNQVETSSALDSYYSQRFTLQAETDNQADISIQIETLQQGVDQFDSTIADQMRQLQQLPIDQTEISQAQTIIEQQLQTWQQQEQTTTQLQDLAPLLSQPIETAELTNQSAINLVNSIVSNYRLLRYKQRQLHQLQSSSNSADPPGMANQFHASADYAKTINPAQQAELSNERRQAIGQFLQEERQTETNPAAIPVAELDLSNQNRLAAINDLLSLAEYLMSAEELIDQPLAEQLDRKIDNLLQDFTKLDKTDIERINQIKARRDLVFTYNKFRDHQAQLEQRSTSQIWSDLLKFSNVDYRQTEVSLDQLRLHKQTIIDNLNQDFQTNKLSAEDYMKYSISATKLYDDWIAAAEAQLTETEASEALETTDSVESISPMAALDTTVDSTVELTADHKLKINLDQDTFNQ